MIRARHAPAKMVMSQQGYHQETPGMTMKPLTVGRKDRLAKGVRVKTGTAEDQSGGGEHAADKTEDESERDGARERTADGEAGIAGSGNNQRYLATIILRDGAIQPGRHRSL